MARSVDDRMSFMEHLGELRVRIVRALTALLVGSVPGLYFSQQIVDWLARPVTKLNYSLVFTSPAEALWVQMRSEEHTSELQSHSDLVCRLLLEKKKNKKTRRREVK